MADDESPGRKTRSLGTLPVSKLQSQKEFKNLWNQYSESAAKFAEAKIASSTNKQKVKDMLKKHVPSLKSVEQIDFIVQPGGRDISIFEVLKTSTRKKASELDFG